MKTYARTIVILADGARPDVLNEELGSGHLPHIQEIFAAHGTNQTILSCFPSTTGPAYLPYLTGCFPGTCNVPGIRWFDKPHYARHGWGWRSFRSYCGWESSRINGDLSPEVKTAWEIFDNPKSIFNGITRGLNKKNDLTCFSRIWHYYYAHLTDRWSFIDLMAYRRLKKMILQKDFDFCFVVFPSVDEFSHRSSPTHARVRQAYAEIDTLLGKISADLQTAGIADETLLVVVSDHGHSQTSTHFDVGPWLENKKKLRTFYYSNIFKFRFDAVSMVSGNGMAHLYFKGGKAWEARKTFEEISHDSILLDELRFHDAVDLVVTQGADGFIHLQTQRGHGWFRVDEKAEKVFYAFDRQDPLGLSSYIPLSPCGRGVRGEGGFSLTESLSLTFDSPYPDIFVQMHQIFKSPRTGDVVVCAKTGFDLREKFEHPIHKSTHGSICAAHMRIPLLMNYRICEKYVRSVDIFPTVLKLMGRKIPEGIDGRVVA